MKMQDRTKIVFFMAALSGFACLLIVAWPIFPHPLTIGIGLLLLAAVIAYWRD